jgi:hypothetical protein
LEGGSNQSDNLGATLNLKLLIHFATTGDAFMMEVRGGGKEWPCVCCQVGGVCFCVALFFFVGWGERECQTVTL